MAEDTARTQIARVIIGTPIRKVTGAQAQTLNDLTDVNVTGIDNKHILQYNEVTGKWENTLAPSGLTIFGGTF